jgi:DNA-binding Xre family transcriptional regulator
MREPQTPFVCGIRFSTLDAICRQLGCQPGDLLAFKADSAPVQENGMKQTG